MNSLLQVLSQSSSSFSRSHAAGLLGDLVHSNPAATPAVVAGTLPLLADTSWDVRTAAAEALCHVCRQSEGAH